jgi:hypothetical protein
MQLLHREGMQLQKKLELMRSGEMFNQNTPNEQYYQLIYIVKTKSKNNTLWISFIEGLHRLAAMVMSLLCSSFDLENNYINPGLLSMKDFKRANIQHF